MSGLAGALRSPAGAVVVRVLRVLVVLAIVVAVVVATVEQWNAVSQTFAMLSWWRLLLSGVLVLLGMAAAVKAWQQVLVHLGHPVTVPDAARCYLVGQLGKYLPGSVWAFVLQVELVRRAGVPRASGFVAVVVTAGLSTTVALLVGLLGLPAVFDVSTALGWVVVGAVPVVLVCAHPAVLTRLVDLVLRLLRRDPLPAPITARGVLTASAWLATSWVLYGVHLWVLAGSTGLWGAAGLSGCTGALALGMGAGVLAVVAPSGLGVREAVVTAALATAVGAGPALGLALASRLVFTLAEVGAGAVAAALGVSLLRRAPVGADPAPVTTAG